MKPLIDYERYGKILSLLFEDRVTAYADVTYTDPVTGIEKTKENAVVVDNEPCRLSFNSSNHEDKIGYTESQTRAVLTTPTHVVIPIGSDIKVTRVNGIVYTYTFSEKPSIHPSHRRYILENKEIS